VPIEYDPMLAKISAWGHDRTEAIARLAGALAETTALGPTTNLLFLRDVLAHPAFAAGATHTGFLADHLPAWRPSGTPELAALVAALATTRPRAAGGSARAGAGSGAHPPEGGGRRRRRGDAARADAVGDARALEDRRNMSAELRLRTCGQTLAV